MLGIVPDATQQNTASAEREAGLIEMLIDLRAQARANQNYEEADNIRDRLTELGVQLDDGPEGTIWRVE